MSQLIQKYENLSCIIDNLKKENENNENSILLLVSACMHILLNLNLHTLYIFDLKILGIKQE